jgi:hypothetical protein
MTGDTFVKAQLALLCWRNAPAGRPILLMRALGFVVRNRVRAGWMGGSWLQVIANDPVWSAYTQRPGNPASGNGSHALLEEFPDLRDDIFQKLLWEVDRIYDGSLPDPMTEGALWWAELERIDRPWFAEHIAQRPEEHPRIAQVANITLWR